MYAFSGRDVMLDFDETACMEYIEADAEDPTQRYALHHIRLLLLGTLQASGLNCLLMGVFLNFILVSVV